MSGYLHRVNWAKLPDGRQLTDVASVAADSKDQIYAFAAPIRWWWSSVNNSDSASTFWRICRATFPCQPSSFPSQQRKPELAP